MSDDDVDCIFKLLREWVSTSDPDKTVLIKGAIQIMLLKQKQCSKVWGSGKRCDADAHPGRTRCLHHIKAWKEYDKTKQAKKRLLKNPDDVGAKILINDAKEKLSKMKRKARRNRNADK